jgi:hypothetical protein
MAAFSEEFCADVRLARGTTEICTVVNTLHSCFAFTFRMTNDAANAKTAFDMAQPREDVNKAATSATDVAGGKPSMNSASLVQTLDPSFNAM